MPLNPSSYSKIFKSKYVQDDDDDPVDVGSTPDVPDDETPSYTPSVPAYSSPKVQELLSKPRPNFDKLFSSRYVDGGSSLGSSLGTPSFKPPEPSPRSYSSYQPAPRAMSEAPSSTKYSTNKDYDKIFTSKYLDEKPTFQKGVNPYIVEENSDDEEPVRHLPPSRSSSIRRATSLRRTYDESAPFTRSYEPRPLKNLVVSRSTTPIRSNYRSETPSLSYRSSKSTTPAPRRIYPQTSSSYDLDDLKDKEEAPVVFDANLTFVLGCKTPMKQYVKPIPAHQESDTQSSALSSKISDFLNRTDHVMQEWQNVGSKRKKREDTNLTGKSRSATNIMIKGFQLYSKANSVGRSSAGNSQYDDDTQDDVDELSEMTADLAEEHSTSTLAAERLDAETADRLRLERELTDMQQKNKNLQNCSEKLEMELLYARSDLTNMSEDEDDMDNEPVYKQRYERVARELEFTKRRLQQQHEDDLEQLVALKKQLEKKLSDAYEEVEEQRQVVGQWKRKVQKLTGEMGDIKLLLEEQTSRNNMLEKKQRKFDTELQAVQEDMKKERQSKDRFGREKEVLTAEKFTLESTIADLRMELDMKDEKLLSLQRELDELTFGGKTEEEVTILRKQKIDCERRLHEQDEELDELAGQVQLLEQAKLKLEMSLEQQRKASKKEAQQHEEELEEVRCNAQKKVKALEAQLENEHEERTVLLREKHEFERRLATALDNDRNEKAVDEAVVQRLKRDLKRTKALLRDTQAQLERQKTENPSKAVIRQLRNQIDDIELARAAAVKSKQLLESELSETQSLLDETSRHKNELEEKLNVTNRERSDLQNQCEENEEELAEVLKKYKTTIQQMSLDQIALQEQVSLVGELEAERSTLKEQLAEMSSRLETVENMGDASSNMLVRRGELKVKELENKLELEQTTRQRLDVQIARLKEAVEKLQHDLALSRNKEQQTQDQIRKLQRNMRELKDEHNNAMTKEGESILKRKELEKKYETLESETSTVRTDLRLALKRIEDLQAVIQNDLEDSSSDSEEQDSYSSDDSVNSFLKNHRLSGKPSIMQIEQKPRSNSSSNIAKDTSYA